MRQSNFRCSRFCVAALLALQSIAFTSGARAETSAITEAQTLLAQGQRAQALEKVDRAIATNPKDKQARFLKGVILADLNKLDEAAAVFVKLTEEAPELPEPYNNLAVIYAQQGQYDKARAALEMAIRTHPSYAVAHENLGDLYARMARQAYDRALQIDSRNRNAQAKLNLLRDLASTSSQPANVRPVLTAAASSSAASSSSQARPAAPASSSSSQAVAVVATAKPATSSASSSMSSVRSSAASVASSSSSASSVVATAKPEPKQRDNSAEEQKKQVRTAIQGWADAWSDKNVKAYLGFYSKEFNPPGKQTRSAWEKEREQRIDKPGTIRVTLSEMDIRINGNTAVARFKQNYQSANFKSASGKTLELGLQGNRWLITQERIGR